VAPIISLLLDVLIGDPPNRLHPTAWMGNWIAFLMRFRPHGHRFGEFMFGVLILLTGLTLAIGAGLALSFLALRLPLWAGILLEAFALKLTISLRGLAGASRDVETALQSRDLPEARRLLSWHLVSRDTSQLDGSRVAAAAIESVAENASDGTIAPLFFYALGGLPAAFAYRFVNTADSMLGYRDAEREWLGKAPALLDDLLNLIPARLTALFIILSAFIANASGTGAWRVMWRDSRLTASPNAGIPMSAMAGALGVELEKADHYVLGKGLRPPNVDDLARARRLLYTIIVLSALTLTLAAFFISSR
jgi:adenosylcobinamide-phosphate synthase